MKNGWISVKERLPEIPEGQYGVSVLIAVWDPVFNEINPGNGYSVQDAIFGLYAGRDGNRRKYFEGYEEDRGFMTLYIGGEEGSGWHPPVDRVTHWMPYPYPPEIPDES